MLASESTSSALPSATTWPSIEQQQPVGVLAGEAQVVHGRDHCQLVVAAQRVDELKRLLLAAEVERARRLVKEQDRCLLGKRPGEYDPLQLAAAQ